MAIANCRTATHCTDVQCSEFSTNLCISFSTGTFNTGTVGDSNSKAKLDGCDTCWSPLIPQKIECLTCQDGSTANMVLVRGSLYFCPAFAPVSCTDPNCDTCAVPSVCTACKTGFYPNQSNGCNLWPERCAACISSTKCTYCKPFGL